MSEKRTRPAFRFAPSPNGRLHPGHALSALTAFDMAQRMGGRFLVRIEDIDVVRCPRHLAEAALEDLAWLGLTWEEPVLYQSAHFDRYRAAADRLAALGLLYPCFASRAEIAAGANPEARDPDGAPLYPGLWRAAPADRVAERLAAGEPFALRLDMARALDALARRGVGPLTFTAIVETGEATTVPAEPERWGDAVLVRKDTPTSYHIAVVVDDAAQGITHVVRGLDLEAATGLHRLLQVLLDLPEPVYHHHRLMTDPAGRKLAKSAGDTSLASLRAAGWSPSDVRRHVGLA